MSLSKKPIPAHHKKTALAALAKNNQDKMFVTEDGHLYVPKNKPLLDYHCQTNTKTYWVVEREVEEAPAAPLRVVKDPKEEAKAEEVANPLSEEEKAKLAESAGAAGAPDPALVDKLKGMSLDKLSAKPKEELKGYAASLNIPVGDADTKPVIAEAILKVVNA